MTAVTFIKLILEFLFYSMLYFGLYFILDLFTPWSFAIAFLITFFINILFNRSMSFAANRILGRPFDFFAGKKKQILDEVLEKLNGEVNYQEVKKMLFALFRELFYKKPHAFYILENNTFFLAHYEFLDEDNPLVPSIDAEYFQQISFNQTSVHLKNKKIFPADLAKSFEKKGFWEILPFFGHSKVFAFLLTVREKDTILKKSEIAHLFRKVQYKAGLLLENTGLFIDLERRNMATHKIIEVSQQILSSLDTIDILDYIIDALSELIYYDAAAIFLLDEKGQELKNTSSRGYDKEIRKNLYLKVGQGACGHVVETKEIDVIYDVSKAGHYFETNPSTRSQISLPILFDGNVLGVICVESNKIGFFTQHEVEILKIFANQAAIAIHNARQVEIRLAKQALEHELLNAGTVQKGLLVRQLPQVNKLNITAENIPSKIVSGDLYDFIKISPDTLGVAIGDVSGKGAPAALMMTLVLAGFRSQNKNDSTTCDTVHRLNDLLTESTIEGNYTTFFYGILRLDTDKIIYTNAGHNPPILLKKNGEIKTLKTGGIVLGFLENQSYKQEEVDFCEGDIFVAFTDGVTEPMNHEEVEFGEDRIIEIVKKHRNKSAYSIKKELINSLQTFSRHRIHNDDLTIIIAKHE